ncbi:DUF6230 family protein [Kitasatospora sp. NBC_01250]|uniref:DUF6230 family protein n=1 Tax=unclassified Kitasatospora TaxID=2633591 RepID=UPI002E14546E|nr:MULTISPECIES: DUF6230 family protein [unclassified Kitasatospora]WSJ70159.1 DUF6230 family protein [Kitasatospora sp. NBC_01302]
MVPSAEIPDEASGAVAATPAPRGRVRLRRAALMAIPACVAGGVLMALTAQGVLAAQFQISGMAFTVTATSLDGNGFEQFGGLDTMLKGNPAGKANGGQQVVAVSVIQDGKLTNLCQSVNLGGTNLKITAGDNGTPVSAENLTTDSDTMSGDANFSNIEVGGDASTFTDAGVKGPMYSFGQQATHVTINNLRQHNYATTAGSFTLPNLHLSFSSQGC